MIFDHKHKLQREALLFDFKGAVNFTTDVYFSFSRTRISSLRGHSELCALKCGSLNNEKGKKVTHTKQF